MQLSRYCFRIRSDEEGGFMSRKKILVVDDEKGFSAMLKLNLESSGKYDVLIENESQKAIQAAIQFRPDLILLDVIMPYKEGPDVASELRDHASLYETPIVFLTATVTKEEVLQQGGRIGGHPFVAKPSHFSDLLQSIERNISYSY